MKSTLKISCVLSFLMCHAFMRDLRLCFRRVFEKCGECKISLALIKYLVFNHESHWTLVEKKNHGWSQRRKDTGVRFNINKVFGIFILWLKLPKICLILTNSIHPTWYLNYSILSYTKFIISFFRTVGVTLVYLRNGVIVFNWLES